MITYFELRLTAILTMTLDHIGYMFFPSNISLRLIGRIAFPIFAFGIAEGIKYTRNYQKYLLRLLIIALISEVPFDLMTSDTICSFNSSNVMFTLLSGACLCCFMRFKLPTAEKIIFTLIPILSVIMNCDYNIIGISVIPIMYYFITKGKPATGALISCLLLTLCFGLWQLPCFFSAYLISQYNGKREEKTLTTPFKITNYLFYPAHILLIYTISKIV